MAVREELSDLEHVQWMYLAKFLMEHENISPERVKWWVECMVPYSELDEETKDHDRVWADKVISIIKKHNKGRSTVNGRMLLFMGALIMGCTLGLLPLVNSITTMNSVLLVFGMFISGGIGSFYGIHLLDKLDDHHNL